MLFRARIHPGFRSFILLLNILSPPLDCARYQTRPQYRAPSGEIRLRGELRTASGMSLELLTAAKTLNTSATLISGEQEKRRIANTFPYEHHTQQRDPCRRSFSTAVVDDNEPHSSEQWPKR